MVPGLIWGQINTESMRSTKQDSGLHLVIGGDLGLYTGNTKYINYKAKLRLDHKGGPIEGFLVGQYQLAEADEKKFIDKAFVHLRGMTNTDRWLEFEGFLQYEYNNFIDLPRRQLAGGGARIRIIDSSSDSKTFASYLGAGVMYELEDIPAQTGEGPRSEADSTWYAARTLLRSTNYLVLRSKLGDGLSVNSTIYYQPAISDFRDYRILWDVMLKLRLTKQLALTNTINLRYDSLPPYTVIEKHDLELITGLVYEF